MGPEDTAWMSYLTVKERNGEQTSGNDFDLPDQLLDPDERAIDMIIGDTSSEDDPILIATDRRVLLARRPASRRWKILKEAPGADVVDASYTKTFLAGRLRVHLRKRPGPLPEQFVATVRSLLGRCSGPIRRSGSWEGHDGRHGR